jgi:hypothetical protein
MECSPPMFGRLQRVLCRLPKCKRRALACIRGNAAHERSRLCRLAKATFVSRFTPSPWLAHSACSLHRQRVGAWVAHRTSHPVAPPLSSPPPRRRCGGEVGGPRATKPRGADDDLEHDVPRSEERARGRRAQHGGRRRSLPRMGSLR